MRAERQRMVARAHEYYKSFDIVFGGPGIVDRGIGARRATFDGMVAGLKDRFSCISCDLRGHGLSPLPEGRFGLDDLVDDLEELRAKLGIGQAHFAGHSLGGMIGPRWAWRYPERVLSPGLWSTAAFRTADDRVRGVVAAMRHCRGRNWSYWTG